MPIEMSIDRMVADLRPVRRHSLAGDAAVFASVAISELALWLLLGFARPDFALASHGPVLWWKLVSLGLIAYAGSAAALASLSPEITPRRGLGRIAAGIGLALVAGVTLIARIGIEGSLVARLDWPDGLMCLWKMAALSVLPAAALAILVRRGAPTDPGGTALASGLGGAGWGAFVFAFACPSDDPLYIIVWYVVGCGLVTAVSRVVIARVARW